MKKNEIVVICTIFVITFFLFYKPALSDEPLGLDTLGHLSKVSYLKTYPFADWDMNWYSGTLFLKLYSPLFYYLLLPFPSSALGANLLCFLSLFLTSLGIYLLVKLQTNEEFFSGYSSLSYLTVLSISYFWISTGNLPYFFSLWTIPFSLYFLEKTIQEKKKRNLIYFSLVFCCAILLHVIVGFLISILLIIRILIEGGTIKNIKRIFVVGLPGILLSAFWFVPFIVYSLKDEEYTGYVPKLIQLFGFGDQVAWGFQVSGIGAMAFLFVLLLFYFKRYRSIKSIQFHLISLFILGFLLFGGLGIHYPYGVDPVRVILPFSIILCTGVGCMLHSIKGSNKKKIKMMLLGILITGLFWNFTIIQSNLNRFTYIKEESRFGMYKNISNDHNFPLSNEYSNFRFGTSKYLFGESLNYFMPKTQQTFGYQDVGMLNAPRWYDLRWHIWLSENVNDSIYWLDYFGIKYFEIENSTISKKFDHDSRFKTVMNYSGGYNFTIYEYLQAKHVIALVDYVNDSSIGNEKEFNLIRNNPDEIQMYYNNFEKGNAIVVKEFYHSSWKAKELPTSSPLQIKEVGPGVMAVYPSISSKGVIFYQSKTLVEIVGFILSVGGLIFLFILPSSKLK